MNGPLNIFTINRPVILEGFVVWKPISHLCWFDYSAVFMLFLAYFVIPSSSESSLIFNKFVNLNLYIASSSAVVYHVFTGIDSVLCFDSFVNYFRLTSEALLFLTWQ